MIAKDHVVPKSCKSEVKAVSASPDIPPGARRFEKVGVADTPTHADGMPLEHRDRSHLIWQRFAAFVMKLCGVPRIAEIVGFFMFPTHVETRRLCRLDRDRWPRSPVVSSSGTLCEATSIIWNISSSLCAPPRLSSWRLIGAIVTIISSLRACRESCLCWTFCLNTRTSRYAALAIHNVRDTARRR